MAESKHSKLSLNLQHLKENHSPNSTVFSPVHSQKNTMLEFRSGKTPKRSKPKLKLLLEDNAGSETQTLPTAKYLNSQVKQKEKLTEDQMRMNIPNFPIGQKRQSYTSEGISEFSSSENIEIKQEYIKLFQEDLYDLESKLPEEITFRVKPRASNDIFQETMEKQQDKCKSPHPQQINKKASIQFAPRSPKCSVPKGTQNKLQKTFSSFDLNIDNCTSNKHLAQSGQKIRNLGKQQIKIFSRRQKELIRQVSLLTKVVSYLENKLILKEQQWQQKSTILLEEINQLIRDRETLQKKLQNIVVPSQLYGSQNDNILIQLQNKLNLKDQIISNLEMANHCLSREINSLQFDIDNLKLRMTSRDTISSASELSIFQQALKFSMQQIINHKQRMQLKDEQIDELKRTYGVSKGQTERTRNQLSIEQLKRITEVQTLRTTFDAERVAKSNEIKDLVQEVSSLKNKINFLAQEVKQKDSFILSKIKVYEK